MMRNGIVLFAALGAALASANVAEFEIPDDCFGSGGPITTTRADGPGTSDLITNKNEVVSTSWDPDYKISKLTVCMDAATRLTAIGLTLSKEG
jgi:hypothetical protein